ncbi:MAG: response regulator [Bacteroidales bacterium]|nr:response regulator [Bacteroidales bacterium]
MNANNQPVVLIVDDVPLNVLLIQKMLSKQPYELRTANNGQQALDAIAAEKPDLILLDLMMPGIDGFEVLRRVRSNPETAEIAVVILSALNSNEDIVKGFDMGANDFITKPIIMQRLLSSVSTQLQLAAAKAKQ